MNVFDHEKLDVYGVAIDFVAIADGIVEGLPRGRGYLADQLLRAATSIVLNIAEGAGEHSRSEKAVPLCWMFVGSSASARRTSCPRDGIDWSGSSPC